MENTKLPHEDSKSGASTLRETNQKVWPSGASSPKGDGELGRHRLMLDEIYSKNGYQEVLRDLHAT